MAEVEQHPMFDPKNKVTAAQQSQTPPQGEPSSKSCDPLDDDDSGPGMFALFDAAQSEKETKPEASSKKKEGMVDHRACSWDFVKSTIERKRWLL